jgi:hypothetical protein
VQNSCFERPDEDDQDLLTFSEAGVRLAEELQAEKSRLADMTQRRPSGARNDDELQTLRQRIADLEDAASRNAMSPDNFLTYRPVRPE